MNKIAKHLNQHIVGAVYGENTVLEGYSTDRSVLKIRPKVVAVPRSTNDIRKLVRFSHQLSLKKFKLPITVRGTGLDKTGAAIGSGLIISMEEMNCIQEIDPRQRLVRVQAGVTIGQLNSALSLHGLVLPVEADPEQTIGGLIANNSAEGLRSHSIQAEIVLSNGDVIQTAQLKKRKANKKKGISGFEGDLYRKLDGLIADNVAAMESIEQNSQVGYPALANCKTKTGSFDILSVFFGSQGTLGVITEVILSCKLAPERPGHLVAFFPSLIAATDFIKTAIGLKPNKVDTCDIGLFREALNSGKKTHLVKNLPEKGVAVHVQLCEASRRHSARKIKKLRAALESSNRYIISDESNIMDFLELQSILSIYLNSSARAIRLPIADGAYVPGQGLKKYLTDLAALQKKYKIALPIFGSALYECYSVRPAIDLSSVAGRQFCMSFLRDYNNLVDSCGGALAGNSAEGRLKAPFTATSLSPELKKLYRECKDIFDPNHIMNPELKQDSSIRAVVRALRTSYNTGIVK